MTEATQPPTSTTTTASSQVTVPRVTIEFCTQCKWNLRAAYYAQELLQTFGTSIGEVALVPSTGGRFVVSLFTAAEIAPTRSETGSTEQTVEVKRTTVWDRKVDGGFPETKELKGRVRDAVEPGRGLGHTDRALKKTKGEGSGKLGSGENHSDGREGKGQVADDGAERDVEKEGVTKEVSAEGDVDVKVGGEVVGKVVSSSGKKTETRECEDCS